MTTRKYRLYKWLWFSGHTYLAQRELNDSLGERVDLEGKSHYFREELSIMALWIQVRFRITLLIILGDTT